MGSCVLFLVHGTILQQWMPLLKNTLLKNRVSAEKKRLSWLLNNRASEYWRIVPANLEESCKGIQKHKIDVWYNVNMASALDIQVPYYVQYQFHKVLSSVLTKAGRGFSEALLTQPLLLQLFNVTNAPLRNIVLVIF